MSIERLPRDREPYERQREDDLEELIESRDMRIKELGDALASLAVREIHAQRRVRELERTVDIAEDWKSRAEAAEARVRDLEARIERLEIRDKMRDDGEHSLMAEIEARDVRIASLTSGMRLWADRAEAAEQRVRELEEALRRIVEYPTADGIAMSAIARTALAESIGREDYKGQP